MLCLSPEEELELCFAVKLLLKLLFKLSLLFLLTCFSFVCVFLHCLRLLFGTQIKLRGICCYCFQQTWNGGQKGTFVGGPCRVLLNFKPLFSLILLNPKGNRVTRKWIQFWTEVNHKFSRGTQFLGDLVSKIKKRTATWKSNVDSDVVPVYLCWRFSITF